jgi:hypothetical protein
VLEETGTPEGGLAHGSDPSPFLVEDRTRRRRMSVSRREGTVDDRYSVAIRQDGAKTWHVVVDGPAAGASIDPRRIVMEFRDRSKAEAHAARLNGKD